MSSLIINKIYYYNIIKELGLKFFLILNFFNKTFYIIIYSILEKYLSLFNIILIIFFLKYSKSLNKIVFTKYYITIIKRVFSFF
jgi:hypothetical protein